MQEHEYEEQVALKQTQLNNLFAKNVHVHPSPQEFGYRTRADIICSPQGIGFRKKQSAHHVVDVENCLLLSHRANEVLTHIRATSKSFSRYDAKLKKGLLRYLTIREGDDGIMIVFSTTTPNEEEQELFTSYLKSIPAQSVYWNVDNNPRDDVRAGVLTHISGNETLTITLNNVKYPLRPFTFFQSNKAVAEQLFSKVKEHAKGRVLDLFCGIGAITHQLTRATSVVGVESDSQAIRTAKTLGKGEFISSDAFEYVQEAIVLQERFDTVIVDPPRTGLGLRMCQALKRLNPHTIIYVSCNPSTLKTDLATLAPYKDVVFEAFDMFPQTDHVESFVVLKKGV